mmetsp:Transcript_8224/g.12631  ORF Transcript_8224/g.12631 Transcript_8224/m.12631 type:complete len:96 (-) Transcript_8224:67-354(-)
MESIARTFKMTSWIACLIMCVVFTKDQTRVKNVPQQLPPYAEQPKTRRSLAKQVVIATKKRSFKKFLNETTNNTEGFESKVCNSIKLFINALHVN